ncbi:hypothetical protein CFR73_10105 [Novacetimonas maltaceti]|uniref:PepSY domain-containing protein n=1 Tax=Novacetimonas maltaceti TaxID=1203393 RepID=A0A2S3W271_9PROT|nr:PepSY-associated TM helix domain-containing protein [Novacetimonas maltaceti]POF62985.1 hypothetical protein KMAL_13600 [Novacetimonas maltaceti]PYD59758.1 hypothetical protein CFR73_10105 [Novacetimonas maltaceti]
MRETLRTRMGWLHTWIGFVCGLVLACICATGTLAVFDTEITRWMQPEIDIPAGTPLTDAALDAAAARVREQQARGIFAFLNLPSARMPVLEVLHYNGHEFTGDVLDPRTGAPIAARATAGGKFFYNFHYTLRGGGTIGVGIVNILALGLLVSVGAGIIIHLRALLPDLVMLRLSGSRIRSWLDAHLLGGVLFLPFTVMMAYTGILVHADTILPARLPMVAAPKPAAAPPSRPAPPLPMVAHLRPLLETARTNLGGRECGFILFSPDRLSISASDASGPFLTRDHVDFALPDGRLLGTTLTRRPIATTLQLMHGLHYARFAPPALRWLYFISGLGATATIATGLVLFLMKRRRQSGHRVAFRIAEGLAIATITGLPIGILSFLWANRMLPAGRPGRDMAEITMFLGIWAACALHGVLRSCQGLPMRGWREQLAIIALLGCGVPAMDAMTGMTAWRHAPALHGGVGAMAFLCGLGGLYAMRRTGGDAR